MGFQDTIAPERRLRESNPRLLVCSQPSFRLTKAPKGPTRDREKTFYVLYH